jgi:polysaccharide biosynthesis/export protein
MISKNYSGFFRFFKISVCYVFAICLLLLSSCITQSKLQYVQDKDNNIKAFKEVELPDYRLKSNDELYIQVFSLDEAAVNVFSNTKQDPYVGSMSPFGASLMSYAVDKDGYVFLPVIGKIIVKDKTLSEVSTILKDSLNHILSQPIVSVKLVNRYVSVLGEVRNPGHFPYSQDKFTIYDAIGLAGDITDYGNRRQVILIRNINGENFRISVDLTKADILKSEYYNLRPNDIVFVKQARQKFWNISQVPISLFLSAITTAILIHSIIK